MLINQVILWTGTTNEVFEVCWYIHSVPLRSPPPPHPSISPISVPIYSSTWVLRRLRNIKITHDRPRHQIGVGVTSWTEARAQFTNKTDDKQQSPHCNHWKVLLNSCESGLSDVTGDYVVYGPRYGNTVGVTNLIRSGVYFAWNVSTTWAHNTCLFDILDWSMIPFYVGWKFRPTKYRQER